MIKILKSVLVIVAVAALATGATGAYFYDNERSVDNSFTSGTLDLKIDGGDVNVVMFNNITDLVPGGPDQVGTVTLKNAGSIDGYLDLGPITVSSQENGCLPPEIAKGDGTCGNPGIGQGELQNVVNLSLFWDGNCDGILNGSDSSLYNGPAGSVPASIEVNKPLASGAQQCVSTRFSWPSGPDDNLAQGDTMGFGVNFNLAQIP